MAALDLLEPRWNEFLRLTFAILRLVGGLVADFVVLKGGG
jgi:hypothetical protein